MTPDQAEHLAAAIRWAKAGAVLNPGVKFIAIVGDRMYSYEEPKVRELRRNE